MRHRLSGRKFSRSSAHRTAMLANLAASVLKHEQVKTTVAKAKGVRAIVDRLITLGKRGGLHARRQAIAYLGDSTVVDKLFATLGPRYAERKGGYTRVLRFGFRYGDAAPLALIELVDRDPEAKGTGSRPAQDDEGASAEA